MLCAAFLKQICVANKIDMIRNVSFIFGLSRDFYGIWCTVICCDFFVPLGSVILQDFNKRVWFAKLALLFILQGHSSEEVVLQSICGACPSLAAGIVQLYASTIQILRYPPISGNKLTTPTGSRDRRHPE